MADNIQSMSFTEAVDYVSSHTDVFRTPIIIDGKKLSIGYNLDDIRIFIPKNYRNLK